MSDYIKELEEHNEKLTQKLVESEKKVSDFEKYKPKWFEMRRSDPNEFGFGISGLYVIAEVFEQFDGNWKIHWAGQAGSMIREFKTQGDAQKAVEDIFYGRMPWKQSYEK